MKDSTVSSTPLNRGPYDAETQCRLNKHDVVEYTDHSRYHHQRFKDSHPQGHMDGFHCLEVLQRL